MIAVVTPISIHSVAGDLMSSYIARNDWFEPGSKEMIAVE